MKAMLREVIHGEVTYQCLAFCCPGCEEEGGSGLHMLPVNTDKKSPAWTFDGNLEYPTISPSILTKRGGTENDSRPIFVCHSYLKAGVFEFLSDCTHSLKSSHVPMPDLPDWFVGEA